MSELQNPVYYPVLEAIRKHTGVTVDRVTAWRWSKGTLKGGRKLETRKLGGRVVSTLEAVEEFLTNNPGLTEEVTSNKQASRSRRQREKENALRAINELC